MLISTMRYFFSVKENNLTISIDGLRLTFEIHPKEMSRLMNWYNFDYRPGTTDYKPRTAPFTYKYLRTIKYADDCSCTFGFWLNGTREDMYKGFIDVNPNKVFHKDEFWHDFNFIRSCTGNLEIARLDTAIDIPVQRQNILLYADRRRYELVRYSPENKTEYLGIRSSDNFVKIYNKTIESKLNYDLTRVEITSAPSYESFIRALPKISILNDGIQYTTDLNRTDRAIIDLIINSTVYGYDCGYILNAFGRTKKTKIERALNEASTHLEISRSAIEKLFKKMYNIIYR